MEAGYGRLSQIAGARRIVFRASYSLALRTRIAAARVTLPLNLTNRTHSANFANPAKLVSRTSLMSLTLLVPLFIYTSSTISAKFANVTNSLHIANFTNSVDFIIPI